MTYKTNEEVDKEFEKKFVKINTKEAGEIVGITLNNEIIFTGKQKDIQDFIHSLRSQDRQAMIEMCEKEIEHTQNHSKGNYADGKVEAFQFIINKLKK